MTPQQKKVKDAAATCKAKIQQMDVKPMSRDMWNEWGDCLRQQFSAGGKKAAAKGGKKAAAKGGKKAAAKGGKKK
jgi:hypothetical protein